MKKLCIYIENQNKIENLRPTMQSLEEKGVQICDLSGAGRAAFEVALQDFEDTLVLTDAAPIASLLAASGCPVLAYIHEGNKEKAFPYVKYVIEGFEDVDGEYFLRVWQRLTGKPWYITETERCIIRETTESDVDAFYEIYREPSITEFMEPLFADRDAELKYVKEYREKVYDFYGFGMWTILDKATRKVIGRAGVSMREGYDDPELGFVIAKEFQGKGLATEVCRAALDFATREFEFTRFQALAHKENTASLGLLDKLGFSYEDTVTLGDEKLQRYILNESPSI